MVANTRDPRHWALCMGTTYAVTIGSLLAQE